MKNAVEQLGMHPSHHYNARTCAAHFISIPLIIFGVMALLEVQRALQLHPPTKRNEIHA